MLTRERKLATRGGFTLVELLVVVAIIVILAGAAVPIYMTYMDDARKGRAKMDIKTLTDTVQNYYTKNSEYPPSLEALIQVQPDGSRPYLEAPALMDPWKRPYVYQYPPQHNTISGKPDIYSMGPNANDPNSIIGNWAGSQ